MANRLTWRKSAESLHSIQPNTPTAKSPSSWRLTGARWASTLRRRRPKTGQTRPPARKRPTATGDRPRRNGASRPGSASGPPSECEPFREPILAKVEQGFEAVRIHQDLVEDHREVRAELLQRAAVHRPSEAEDAAAVSSDGDGARRGGPSGLRHRRAGP